ncbi:MAG: hypothetical protein KC501_10555 [Myxococcales bacterium]|nr:hypothetical protein [Myxococcales bacterium]
MTLPAGAEAERLRGLLRGLGEALERLLMGGMTTATKATHEELEVAFREVSRRGLSRLGSTLRILGQEVGRYLAHDAAFSGSRLSLFLGRTWVLARGLAAALERGDEASFARLAAFDHRPTPVAELRAVTLGVAKKVITGLVCMFDFRMRRLGDDGTLGEPFTFTEMFPLARDRALPPESLLELQRPQKYRPRVLLGDEVITFRHALLTSTGAGDRLALPREAEDARVEVGERFAGWDRLPAWDLAAAGRRVRVHEIDPLELPVELQEEVVLDDWSIGAPERDEARQRLVYPVRAHGLRLRAVVSSGDEGATLRAALDELRRRARPGGRLFGLVHYEDCAFELQPLSRLESGVRTHLMVSAASIDRKALLKSIRLR